MEINEKVKSVKIYEVEGKEFTDKKQAEEHLANLKKELSFTYYVVSHSPDLTEGRGYQRKSKIAVAGSRHNYESLMHYLSKRFGSPLEFIQGVEPIPNYSISSSNKFDNLRDLDNFKSSIVYAGLGLNREKEVTEITYVNSKGEEM